MRFMLLMYPGHYGKPAAGPNLEAFRAMGRFNEELEKAGVLLDLGGLYPPSEAARVRFRGGEATVTDGPFAEAKEIVGGFWIIQASSRAEAIEWITRCPAGEDSMIEIRQLSEFEEFPAEVREMFAEFPAMAARRERLRRRE